MPRAFYRFRDLVPGSYRITATMDGFKTVVMPDIRVLSGVTVTLDIPMEISSVEETVTVSGAASLVDTTSAGTAVVLTNEILQNLPIRNRSLGAANAVINEMPGANQQVAFGGSQNSNAASVDGVAVAHPADQSTLSAQLNFNWIEEVQLSGVGSNAEYGDFGGVASNMIVRSGGNRFSGLGEYHFRDGGWVGDNTGSLSPALRTRFKPQEVLEDWDTSAQLGGRCSVTASSSSAVTSTSSGRCSQPGP